MYILSAFSIFCPCPISLEIQNTNSDHLVETRLYPFLPLFQTVACFLSGVAWPLLGQMFWNIFYAIREQLSIFELSSVVKDNADGSHRFDDRRRLFNQFS